MRGNTGWCADQKTIFHPCDTGVLKLWWCAEKKAGVDGINGGVDDNLLVRGNCAGVLIRYVLSKRNCVIGHWCAEYLVVC